MTVKSYLRDTIIIWNKKGWTNWWYTRNTQDKLDLKQVANYFVSGDQHRCAFYLVWRSTTLYLTARMYYIIRSRADDVIHPCCEVKGRATPDYIFFGSSYLPQNGWVWLGGCGWVGVALALPCTVQAWPYFFLGTTFDLENFPTRRVKGRIPL